MIRHSGHVVTLLRHLINVYIAESDAYEARVKQMEQDKQLRKEALLVVLGSSRDGNDSSSSASSSDEVVLDRVKGLVSQLRDRETVRDWTEDSEQKQKKVTIISCGILCACRRWKRC
jgi:hypothetical protein